MCKKAVSKLNGVERSDVNIATEKLTVSYDENESGFEDIKKSCGRCRIRAIRASDGKKN